MLIQKHLGLVYKQLHKFKLADDPDAISIGYEALYCAIKDFDSSKGNKISTIATVYIYNALGSYVRKISGKRRIKTVSYNEVVFTDDQEDHELLEYLALSVDIEEEYMHKELCEAAMEAFINEYDKLTNEKHKAILDVWRKSEFVASTKEIGSQVGVSQSYVSQVINNFKFRLKKKLEVYYYD